MSNVPLESLLKRAERALNNKEVKDVVVKVRAIIGAAIPASEPLAQAAWDKLRNGDAPTAEEMAALEIVIRLLRPAPLSVGGTLQDLPEAPGHDLYSDELKAQWMDFQKKVQPLLYSVGRIDSSDGTHFGTGFLVAPGVLATNRHVLDQLTFGTGMLAPGRARVNFQREQGVTDKPDHLFGIEGVIGFHPTLDMALLKVPEMDRPHVEIDDAAIAEGHRVVALGYPARDEGRNPAFASSIFGSKYGVKRAALGEALDAATATAFFHDCSTLGGNSGSPIFSLTSGRVVGIHRAGFFMYRNEAVPGSELGRYVAGIAFSKQAESPPAAATEAVLLSNENRSDRKRKRCRVDPYISLHFEDLVQQAPSASEEYVATRSRKKGHQGATGGLEAASGGLEHLDPAPAETVAVNLTPEERQTFLDSGVYDSLRSTKRQPSIPVLIQLRRGDWDRDIVGLQKGSWLGRILTGCATEQAIADLQEDPDVISVEASRDGGILECARSMSWANVPMVHMPPRAQRGRGALVAIVDAGIDVLHHCFRDAANQSRILWVWDQRDDTGPSPAASGVGGFDQKYGTLHSRADINGYITSRIVAKQLGRDRIGHGTHVASIAAGSPLPAANFPGGVAPEADIIVVIPKLSVAAGAPVSLGYSATHADALAFIRQAAEAADAPVVVNVSLGMNAGAHDGTSLLEQAFDNFSRGGSDPGFVIVKSAGNEFGSSGHTSVNAFQGGLIPIEWRTSGADRVEDYLEFWFSSCDDLNFKLVAPNGLSCTADRTAPASKVEDPAGQFFVSLTLTRFHPDNGDSLLQVRVRKKLGGALRVSGLWRLEILGNAVYSDGLIHGWVERDDARAVNFITGSTNELTLSIPATARTVIAVGACAPQAPLMLSTSSSRGPTRDQRSKPELVAPGVGIIAAAAGSDQGMAASTGTSMAAPHVTGAVALLLAHRRAAGKTQVNAAQVKAALSQCLRNFNGRWQPGFGNGGLDVDALLRAFD